jgi:hypothetical protein
MIQSVLRDIGGIGLYGVISVCLFFIVFTVALVRACLLKKPFLQTMGALPLEDGARPSATSEPSPRCCASANDARQARSGVNDGKFHP